METKTLFAHSLAGRMWTHSWLLTCALASLFVVYVYFLDGSLSTLLSWSKVVAGTSAMVLGISLSLGSMGYYFDFLDKQVLYRKYLGLVGFWLALFYSVMLLFVNPNRYFFGFFDNLGSADFVFGLAAMAIFTMMALISNVPMMKWLGPERWRSLLSLGYVAYALLVIRAIFIEGEAWMLWWQTPDSGLAPARLVISVFAVAVLLLRLSVPISKLMHSKHDTLPGSAASTTTGT